MYYRRWKDFKSSVKDVKDKKPDDDHDGDGGDSEEDDIMSFGAVTNELVNELDRFASYDNIELTAVQKYFLVMF
jgi:hypothetical protein